MDDLKQYRSMFEDQRSRGELRSPPAQLFHNSDSSELKHILKKLGNAEDDKEAKQEALKISMRQLEATHNDTLLKLQRAENQSEELKQMLGDAEEDAVNREAVIEQAQGIIKRLNYELESMAAELNKAEKQVEQYKREHRLLEKSAAEAAKQISDVNVLKKTEERLRREVASLKAEMKDLADLKNSQVSEATDFAEQAAEEKRLLEQGIEMVEAKLEEIERQNHSREEILTQQASEIEGLKVELKIKQEEAKHMQEEYDTIEAKRNEEFSTLKRHAENIMRQLYPKVEASSASKPRENLQKSFSTVKKCPATKKLERENKENLEIQLEAVEAPQLVTEDLKLQLEEAQARELELRMALLQIIEGEGKFIETRLETLKSIECTARPEVERWVMRNEELEQHLGVLAEDNQKLLKLICDLQKAIGIKTKQMLDHKQLAGALQKELTVALEFVRLEVIESHGTIARDLLPLSGLLLQDYTAESSRSKRHCSRETSKLRRRLEHTEKHLADVTDKHQEVCLQLMAAREALAKTDADFKEIRLALEIGEAASERTPSFRGDELDYTVQVSHPAGEILSSIKALKHLLSSIRSECYDKLTEIERARPDPLANRSPSYKEVDDLKARFAAKEADWARERQRLYEQIRNAKGDGKLLGNEFQNSIARSSLEDQSFDGRNSVAESQSKLRTVHPLKLLDYSTLDDSVDAVNTSTRTVPRKYRPSNPEDSFLSEPRDLSHASKVYQDRLLIENRELHREVEALKMQVSRNDNLGSQVSPIQTYVHKRSNSESRKVFALPKRSADISTGEQMAQYYEKIIETKDSLLAKLEDQIDNLQKSQDSSLRGSVLNSMRSSGVSEGVNGKGGREHESLEIRYDKLKWKAEQQKKRFARKVQEFELILQLFEEKISCVAAQKTINSKPSEGIDALVKRSPNLKRWIDNLNSKLELLGPRQIVREKRTLCEIVSLIMDHCEVYADLEDLTVLYKELSGDCGDINSVSNRVVDCLYKAFRILHGRRGQPSKL